MDEEAIDGDEDEDGEEEEEEIAINTKKGGDGKRKKEKKMKDSVDTCEVFSIILSRLQSRQIAIVAFSSPANMIDVYKSP